ncbi:MAG: sugar ABC transporter ATP-binding protein, partial [Actinobacteria bacterium]|nr:sugar ABC transporter ATP-binding protein [Actinomycetota bacterium]
GSGHHAVLDVVAGLRRPTGGRVTLAGRASGRPPRDLRAAVRGGVALVSGDRARGLHLEAPIWENIAHVRAISLGRDGAVPRRRRLRDRARSRVAELGVKARDVDQPVGALSGGNQQKVVLAKWLEAEPSVLLLDDPTRGVDVGAKAEMHALVRAASRSCVVLLCSTDLDEMVGLCDRVLVCRGGRIVDELAGARLTRHELLAGMNAAG